MLVNFGFDSMVVMQKRYLWVNRNNVCMWASPGMRTYKRPFAQARGFFLGALACTKSLRYGYGTGYIVYSIVILSTVHG